MPSNPLQIRTVAILGVLVLATVRAPAFAAPTAEDWSSTAREALPAVVKISIDALRKVEGVERRALEVGTGFLIDPSGVIVTNRHVIDGAFRITVTMNDQSEWNAKLLGAAGMIDIAVLKINVNHPLPFLKFADSDKSQIGDPVMVIGNPLGLGISVSTGVISAVHRDLMNTPLDDFIQTDATINRGNSGGPMFDKDGNVIGVATKLITTQPGEGSNGLGLGIASTVAAYTVQHLLNPASTVGWIGVHLQDVTPSLQHAFDIPHASGCLVTQTEPGSPAREAGLRAGDVITRYGDKVPENARALMRDIVLTPINTTVPITYERDDQIRKVDITVADWKGMHARDASVINSTEHAAAARPPDLGLILTPMTDAARQFYKFTADSGVVVAAVQPTSEASTMGVTAGDVIQQVQGTDVGTPDDAIRMIKQAQARKEFVAILVARKDGSTRWIALYSGFIGSQQDSPAEPPRTGTPVAPASGR